MSLHGDELINEKVVGIRLRYSFAAYCAVVVVLRLPVQHLNHVIVQKVHLEHRRNRL